MVIFHAHGNRYPRNMDPWNMDPGNMDPMVPIAEVFTQVGKSKTRIAVIPIADVLTEVQKSGNQNTLATIVGTFKKPQP